MKRINTQTLPVFAALLMAAAPLAACGDDDGGGTPDAMVSTIDAAQNAIDATQSTIDATQSTIDATQSNPDATVSIDATPGPDAMPLPDATPPDAGARAELVINEAVFDLPGNDTAEYIEIKGNPNTDYSAYWIVQLDGDDGGNPGEIISAHQIGTTDANGYWDTGNMSNQLQNGTQTLLLVKDYTGSNGNDLDTDDNGDFETSPWSAAIDGFAMRDGNGPQPNGASDIHYSGAAFLDKAGSGMLGGASRIPDGTDTDTAADWVFNAFDGVADNANEANNTRGAENTVGTN